MASFTSVKSGDWNDPTVWGNLAGGEYPAKTTDEDTVLISNGHTVTYNIDNSSSGTNHRLGSITWDGHFHISTSQSTYLWIRGQLDPSNYIAQFRCGSYASPLSSSYTFTVEYDLASAGQYDWFNSGGDNSAIFDLHGSPKTQKAYLSASASSAQADITFSTIPSDWAVGDRLVVLSSSETTTARYSETEEVVISSIASNTATLTGNLSYTHSAGTMVMNMSRNIKFFSTNSLYQPNSAPNSFMSTSENIEFQYIGNDYWSEGSGANNDPWIFTGCTWSGTKGEIFRSDSDEGVSFKECSFYNTGTYVVNGPNRVGSFQFEDCLFVDTVNITVPSANRASKWRYINCVFACNRSNVLYDGNHEIEVTGCYFYGNYGYSIYPRECTARITSCVFGQREDGTSQTNLNASIRVYNAMVYCNDCLFNDATVLSSHEADSRGPTLWSSNHNQVYGAYRVWSGNGSLIITDDQVTYRTSAPSIQFNPQQDAHEIVFKFQFLAAASTEYTISIYGKRSSTGWSWNPYFKAFGCGINSATTWTTDDTNWNEETIVATTTRAGIVEVEITTLDNGGDFNIDDITVTAT